MKAEFGFAALGLVISVYTVRALAVCRSFQSQQHGRKLPAMK